MDGAITFLYTKRMNALTPDKNKQCLKEIIRAIQKIH